MTILNKLKIIITTSVFKSIPDNTAMNDVLATIFHRFSATVYAFYSLWAVISVFDGLPTIVKAEGDHFQFWFSVLVLITAAPSCLGATFWPHLARIELFFGASFGGLIALYLYFILKNVIEGDGSFAGWFLIWSIMVLPTCRTIVVIVLLVRQERERKAKNLPPLIEGI
jgi:hypothetical protein